MITVSRILHAGYIFDDGKTKIAFDTIFENPFSRNCYAFPSVKFDLEQVRALKLDAVFISHFHDDHCSFESLNSLDRSTPIYMFCVYEEMFEWIKELGFTQVYPLTLSSPVTIGDFKITPRRALDADVDSLLQIQVQGLNILNVVDSWIDYRVLDLLANEKPWDLIMWPFQTMRELEVIAPSRFPAADETLPPEWMEQLAALNPKVVIPSSCQFKQESWSWYNNAFFPVSYEQFTNEVKDILPSADILRLDPGQSIAVSKNGIVRTERLPWIIPDGPQDLDYEYKRDLKPPSTAEVAKHFPQPEVKHKERVEKYVGKELLEKFSSLPASDLPYFESPRIWQLSLFEHNGGEQKYFYQLDGNNIELLADWSGDIEWLTEVPLMKVYGALESGESLTSMYVRINDFTFKPEIEKEIAEADIMEDPLVRCLFTGEFGSYQLEQLKKLTSSQGLSTK
jgi:Predicted Zn-dependent hydrolases of the beta-lactamase fold